VQNLSTFPPLRKVEPNLWEDFLSTFLKVDRWSQRATFFGLTFKKGVAKLKNINFGSTFL